MVPRSSFCGARVSDVTGGHELWSCYVSKFESGKILIDLNGIDTTNWVSNSFTQSWVMGRGG